MPEARPALRAMTTTMSIMLAGSLIGTGVAILLSVKPLAVAVLLAGMLVSLPALVLDDSKPYWLALFLVAAHLGIAKSLLDGLTVLDALRIDYGPFVFVPEIRASDLPFLVLLLMWGNDLRLGRTTLYMPAVGWLALGFLAWSAIALVVAHSRYLAAVEFVRQAKFVLVFLYAANNLGSKRVVRWLWLLVLFMVLFQGGVTIFRFTFGFYDSFFGDLFGRTLVVRGANADLSLASEGWLSGFRNSFGTTMSGGVTSQLLILGLPFATFAAMRNPLFTRGLTRRMPFCAGLAGLLLTFSRSSVISGAIALALSYALAVRRRYLSRSVALAIGLGTVLGVFAMIPLITMLLTRRPENVTIRLEQYQTALAMFRDHPLLGVGLNNSTGEAQRYGRYSYSLIDVTNRTTETPIHSFPVTLLAEAGVVGFLLYTGFFTSVAVAAWRLARPPADPDDACSVLAFLLGMVGLAMGVMANPLFDDGVQTFLWLYAGAIIAIGHRVTAPAPVLASRLRPALAT
jgi:O-antigen ligase